MREFYVYIKQERRLKKKTMALKIDRKGFIQQNFNVVYLYELKIKKK